jgi:hypothetical protein
LGNLIEEPLYEILDSLAGHPAMEAINAGKPERMGLTEGWTTADFFEASRTTMPDGADYQNLCIGCDRYFTQVLGPILDEIRNQRRANRHGLIAIS